MGIAALSGAAAALCLPPVGLCLLAWFCLAPMVRRAEAHGPGRAFKTGWAAGCAFHAVAFHWIYLTCRFARVPVPVALAAWGLLAAFQGLGWGAAAALARACSARLPPGLRAFAWAAAWTACAAALERWTPRLPGDLLEYTQWRHASLFQAASLGGPHLLGFVIVLFNAALAQVWEESQGAAPRGGRAALACAAGLAAACFLYGTASLAGRPEPGPAARVEILQPNVDQYAKWDDRWRDAIMDNFAELLARPREAAPTLVIWPESALPRIVDEATTIEEGRGWAATLKAPLLLGAVTRRGEEHFNSVLMIGSDGAVRAVYHKRELVPFGEYIPFESWLRPLVGQLNGLGGITAGAREQPLLDTPFGLAAAGVCYEAVFPRWARRDAARGARAMVNVTNDGWYKDTWGPHQHYYTNVFRAVENRLTVVRAGNTGISAVIDPWGLPLARLALGERGRLDASVPLDDPFPRRSPYARGGDVLGLLCAAACAAALSRSWARA